MLIEPCNDSIRGRGDGTQAGEIAECARQLVLEPYLVLLNDVRLTSLFPISTYETMATSRVETNQHL